MNKHKPKIKHAVIDLEQTLKTKYIKRNKLLKKGGFKSYQDFLESETWEELKNAEKGEYCEECFSTEDLHLHHVNYSDLSDNLITLCKDCHRAIHDKEKESIKLQKLGTVAYYVKTSR